MEEEKAGRQLDVLVSEHLNCELRISNQIIIITHPQQKDSNLPSSMENLNLIKN